MAIFRPKPWVNPLGQMSIFRLFELLVFLAQKGVFSFQNITKHIFLANDASKKKNLEKWLFFDQNHGKMSIFLLFELLVFIALKGVFLVLEYYKRHFPSLYCLKKKVEKMAIFRRKPWVNPFGKISIFRLFELLLFIAQKGVFLFQNIMKHIFQAYIALKKKTWKNGNFWTKTIG